MIQHDTATKTDEELLEDWFNNSNEHEGFLGFEEVEPTVQPVHNGSKKMKWSKETNILIMKCYYKSKPLMGRAGGKGGYMNRMFNHWNEIGIFPSSRERIANQARKIRTNNWLSELELEEIRREIDVEESAEIQDENVIETTEAESIRQNVEEENRGEEEVVQ